MDLVLGGHAILMDKAHLCGHATFSVTMSAPTMAAPAMFEAPTMIEAPTMFEAPTILGEEAPNMVEAPTMFEAPTMAALIMFEAPTTIEASSTSTYSTPPHQVGSQRSMSALRLDAVPRFPCPSKQAPTCHYDEVDPHYTPRINMAHFLPTKPMDVDLCSSKLDDPCLSSPLALAVASDDVDGFLDQEECLLHGVGDAGLVPGFNDDHSTVDSNDSSYDWSEDTEFMAFVNGTWHPDM